MIIGCLSAGSAHAFFGDREQDASSTVQAGTVDIILEEDAPLEGADRNMGDHVTGSVRIANAGSLRARYSIAVSTAGDPTACDALALRITHASQDLYDGALRSARVDAQLLDGGDSAVWDFDARVVQNVQGTCTFTFVIDARQADGSGAYGFSDTEETQTSSIALAHVITTLDAPSGITWHDAHGTTRTCDAQSDAWTNAPTTTFAWQSVTDAQEYEYSITSPQSATTTGVTHSRTTPQTAPDVEGAWTFRVRARAATVTSPWSDTCTLHIDRTPPQPTSPVAVDFTMPPQTQHAANGVIFTWTTDEPTAAAVYFDKNPANYFDPTAYTYHAPEPPAQTFTQTQRIVTAFPTPGTYFYLVTMTDRAGNTTVSPPGVFNVPSLPTPDVITLNEIVANPVGHDNAAMPHGEWVELYNRGALPVDVAGWRIKDAAGKSWVISTGNSDADGDPTDTGETEIAPGGYLVVYRNGASMTLNNSGGEEVFLYDAYGTLMDHHAFTLDGMPEGKSVARFPDGVGVWIDPDGTPGGANTLSERERDALRAQVFAQCFRGTRTLIVRDAGTVCDPLFVAYLGMIKDAQHVGLVRDEFLKEQPTEGEPASEKEKERAAASDSAEVTIGAPAADGTPTDSPVPASPNDRQRSVGKPEDDVSVTVPSHDADGAKDDGDTEVPHARGDDTKAPAEAVDTAVRDDEMLPMVQEHASEGGNAAETQVHGESDDEKREDKLSTEAVRAREEDVSGEARDAAEAESTEASEENEGVQHSPAGANADDSVAIKDPHPALPESPAAQHTEAATLPQKERAPKETRAVKQTTITVSEGDQPQKSDMQKEGHVPAPQDGHTQQAKQKEQKEQKEQKKKEQKKEEEEEKSAPHASQPTAAQQQVISQQPSAESDSVHADPTP